MGRRVSSSMTAGELQFVTGADVILRDADRHLQEAPAVKIDAGAEAAHAGSSAARSTVAIPLPGCRRWCLSVSSSFSRPRSISSLSGSSLARADFCRSPASAGDTPRTDEVNVAGPQLACPPRRTWSK